MKVNHVTQGFLTLGCLLMLLFQASPPKVQALAKIQEIAAQSVTGPTACISEAPLTASYPNVQINFRMFDQSLLPITDLTDQQIRISENGKPAVPLKTNLQVSATRGGIDFYFVLDRSNRADPRIVKGILQEFINYYQPDVDTITIYTDANNSMIQYYPSSEFSSLTQAVANFPEQSEDSVRSIHTVLDGLTSQFLNAETCSKPRVVYFLLGDETFSNTRGVQFAEIAKTARAKLTLLHVPNPRDNSFHSAGLYEGSMRSANGIYKQIVAPRDDMPFILNQINSYRQVYTASYQTNNGESGAHTIQVEYMGSKITTAGRNTYTINLLPPKVTLSSETVVVRNALEKIDGGFSYDKDSQDITLNVTWPDGYPRQLASSATMVITGQSANEQRLPISLSDTGNGIYKFSWNFATIQERGQHDLGISIEVTDEFGLTARTDAGIQITILNKVSPSVYFKTLNWLLYVLVGLVVILLVAIIFMWRRIGNLALMGGKVLTRVADGIKRTIVGGGKKGKPMAILKVIDGPTNMIGQDLKVFTEKVSLGRDPRQSDFTFYGPDVNSSVSGLHAILERVNGGWRIVAVSQSGSETYVDNAALAFNVPVSIQSGQQVRLGYLAQQPAIFEFQLPSPSSDKSVDAKKTDVGADKTVPIGLIQIDKANEEELKKQASEEKDSLFKKYS